MRSLVVLSLLVLVGCRSNRVSLLTNDVEVAETVPCGRAFVGFETSCSLTITNRARRAVSVSFSSAAPFELPAIVEVAAGMSTDVEVHFRPVEPGDVSRALTASIEGHDVEVQVSGEGVAVPSCVSTDDCREQTFDPARGCVETVRADGASCGQGDVCLVNATCRAGQCVGAPRSCDDGSACTTDACDPSRRCLHEAITCAPSTNPCLAAACDARLGCVAEPVVDGTNCGTNDCETAHVCFSGQCVERTAPQGSTCAPATACRGEGRCTAEKTCALPPPGAPTEAFRFELPADRVVQQLLVATTGDTFLAHGPQGSMAPPSTVLVSLDRRGRTRFEVDLTAEVPGLQTTRALMLDAPNHRLFVSLSSWQPAMALLQARDSRTGALLWQRHLRALNIPILNSDTGALSLSVQSIALVGTDDVMAQLVEGASLHQQHLVTFAGNSGVERWRAQRPGHGTFLVSGDGQAWGSWAACWSWDNRFSRIDGAGRSSFDVPRGGAMAMLGDSAILPGLDGGLVSLSADLRTERRFVLPANQTVESWSGVGAQDDELTVFTSSASGTRLLRTTPTGLRWAVPVESRASWKRLELVADGGVALSFGSMDGGSALSVFSSDGVELERCSMNGRVVSGFADELVVTTEKNAIVGLRFPGLGAAKSGWPDSDGIDGTRRFR
ncbi:MAG: hypothetical protein JNM69_01105 [Archangium sp.]|nr:hypothetical protein [Archangium sp.]